MKTKGGRCGYLKAEQEATWRPAVCEMFPPAGAQRWKRAPFSAPLPLQGRAHIREKVESVGVWLLEAEREQNEREREREGTMRKVGQRYRSNQAWEQHPRLSAELQAALVSLQDETRHQTTTFLVFEGFWCSLVHKQVDDGSVRPITSKESTILSHYQAKMMNILWFWLIKCEDLLLFCVLMSM